MRRLLLILLCFLPLPAKCSDSIARPPKLIHTQWYCGHEHLFRKVDIYIPSDTLLNTELPVLYLLHGINGYEGSWQKKGGAIDTVTRLIAEGKCPPMMVVMPDCNKWPTRPHPGKKNLWTYLLRYHYISHEHDLEQSIVELMDMIDSTYCVSTAVMAGLSDGARLIANVANRHPGRVVAVGMFSPVLHKAQLPDKNISTPEYGIHIYVGKQDIFYPYAKCFHKRLDKQQYPHQWNLMRGTHDWDVWSQCLSLFLQDMDSTIGKWSE